MPVIGKVIIPFFIGILAAYYSGFEVYWFMLLIILSFLTLFSIPAFNQTKKLSPVFSFLVALFFFSSGVFITSLHDSRNQENYFGHYLKDAKNDLLIHVTNSPELKTKSVKVVGQVTNVNDDKVSGQIVAYFERSPESESIQYGDWIQFSAWVNPVQKNSNPHTFDFREYLRKKDFHHQTYVKSEDWVLKGNESNFFWKTVYRSREYCATQLEEANLAPENEMVAKALILGDKTELDKDLQSSFAVAGAMHVLAVSGLHVGILMLLLSVIFKPVKRLKRGKVYFTIIVLLGIWSYALITGMSPSVLRASVMFSFIVVGMEIQRDSNVYQSILVSAFILMVLNPLIIFEVGFQLSYAAVIGIVYLQPKIYNWFYIENRILNKIWQITAVSIAAQIATLPLTIFYFHQFPNYSIVSNLFVIPLAFAILLVGIAYLIFSTIPGLSDIIAMLLDWLLSFLNEGISLIQDFPYAISSGFSIYWFEVLIIYSLIILLIVSLVKKSARLFLSSQIVLIIFLAFNLSQNFLFDNEKHLVIYSLKNELAIDVFEGRKNTFIHSKNLGENDESIDFNIRSNWNYFSGKSKPFETAELSDETEIIKLGNQSCFLLDSTSIKSLPKSGLPRVDLIILRQLDFIPNKIVNLIDENQIKIITADHVSFNLRKYLKSRLNSERIHDLTQDGPYFAQF